MTNEYGRLVEQAKVDLIARRARRKGFRPDEIDDVLQVVVPVVIAFDFDAERSNGATETTVLVAVIDRQLAQIRRGHARRLNQETKYRLSCGARDGRVADEPCVASDEPRLALVADVQEAVGRLSSRERTVCSQLADGEARAAIARSMGLSRYGVDRLVDGIQAQFEAWGLAGWVHG